VLSNRLVLVIGSNGFIGTHIIGYLKKNLVDYVAISRKNCNLLSLSEVNHCLAPFKKRRLDIIFAASVVRRKQDSKSTLKDNILMASNFIQSTSNHNINSVIFLSSVDVYYNNNLILKESSYVYPINYYGIAKLCSEAMLERAFNKKLTILRLPGVYGKGDKNSSIIGSFTGQIRNKVCLNLINKGIQYRDYLYVGDVSKAITMLLDKPTYGIFNLSSGKSLKIIEIIRLISNFLEQTPILKELGDEKKSYTLKFQIKNFLKHSQTFFLLQWRLVFKSILAK
jgi:nucleoside-diphosphate-sugar epimerase